ncbi:hypothetical protein STCU_00635 [Strigomonas culicis]|uniref:Uncharacterized protein n=1 Tax=Strigomonas culicis TaxID=28005 RepID=S9V5I0_9TRYP|nr:hypothetical protein STCU_00635 [Strigomonas culicis]|eukprot:EPY36339.1 hypothetical protein STCU_00635 [Strigomonas culicis]
MLDLLERQPQFPALHLERASRLHYVELFKTLVLDRALAPIEVWDKALLYRAILRERRAAYPPAFAYILTELEHCVLAPGGPSGDDAAAAALQQRCPTQADADYFVYMVKKYYIDNAVEGHVLLRCHREPQAKDLLFSNPPPKSDEEVQAAMRQDGAPAAAVGAPARYPPVEALWRCEENLPLLKVLVFAELNLLVSENPFVKFPQAQAALTRPYAAEAAAADATEGQRGGRHHGGSAVGRGRAGAQDAVSLASVIADRRGHLLAPIPRNTAMAIDGRAGDVRRLQQRHHREDTAAFHALLKRDGDGDGDGAAYTAYADWFYLNPRAVRAEERDGLHRQGLAALRLYDEASRDLYRVSYAEAEAAAGTRPVEGENVAPSYLPTLPHFVALVAKDRHVSYLQHVLLGSDGGARELERRVGQLARALHQTALEYHVERSRRVHRQKVNVAACLLDRLVEDEWRRFLQQAALTRASQAPEAAHAAEDAVASMARRIGSPRKFETRILDESGFATDARVEDYTRWMAAPAAPQ